MTCNYKKKSLYQLCFVSIDWQSEPESPYFNLSN